MKKIFNNLWKIYNKNNLIKNILVSISGGLIVASSYILIDWYFNLKSWWVGLIGLVLTASIIYCVKNQADKKEDGGDKKFARTLDNFGSLSERAVTAAEVLESGDNSLMATVQRLDTIKKVDNLDKKQFNEYCRNKNHISKFLIFSCVLAGMFLCLTTVNILAAVNVLPSGQEIHDNGDVIIKTYELCYDVEGDGEICGEVFQVVEMNQNGSAVIAKPEDGWEFIQWSDGLTDPYRLDENINKDISVYAVFQELEDENDNDKDDGDGEPTEEQGQPSGEPSNKQGDQGNQNSDNEGGGEGGQYEESNQVIDGETYYGGNVYNNYYNDMINSNNKNSNSELSSVVEDYYRAIQKK